MVHVCQSARGRSLCLPPGPGQVPGPGAGLSGQRSGSVLIFNLYTSKVDTDLEDSRIVLTNTDQTRRAAVHLFFVDGQSGLPADSVIELTPSQTLSILASEVDPGTTGYPVAIAIGEDGCPAAFNHLIGESLIRFESGHSAALTAPAVTLIDAAQVDCHAGMVTTELRFDGLTCSALPRTLAISSLAARATGNDTLLFVNRLGEVWLMEWQGLVRSPDFSLMTWSAARASPSPVEPASIAGSWDRPFREPFPATTLHPGRPNRLDEICRDRR
jgi:hypothetical protein